MPFGGHICALYAGREERTEALAEYVGTGLAAADKCVYIVEGGAQEDLLTAIDSAPPVTADGVAIDVDGCIESGQFELLTAAGSYLRTGEFSIDDILEFSEDSVSTALAAGCYTFSRNAGDATGIAGVVENFGKFVYEAELNRFVPQHPQSILYLYDVDTFRGGIVLEILRTPPEGAASPLGSGEPSLSAPGRVHRRPSRPERTMACPGGHRAPSRRACGYEAQERRARRQDVPRPARPRPVPPPDLPNPRCRLPRRLPRFVRERVAEP
jgi:MEDS: MEthanogen/methylotroph, DcmR Sensory domain